MAEKEYIERGAAKKDFENLMQDNDVMCPVIKVLDALEIIEQQPTADVQEVRHGKWIMEYLGHGEYRYKCSHCSAKVGRSYVEDFGHKNFCPDCGSKMDGGKTNV